MMTRKISETAARAIRDARPDESDPDYQFPADSEVTHACDSIARNLADIFAADNPRFDRAKFLDATRKD